MSEQATEPGVDERGDLRKRLKTRRRTVVLLGDVIEAGLFIGGWQFRSHRRCVIGTLFPSNRHLSAQSRRTYWGRGSHE
jgi:hypothetical protein